MKQQKFGRILINALVIGLAATLLILFVRSLRPKGIDYSQVVQLFQEQRVRQFEVNDDVLYLLLDDGTQAVCYLESAEAFREDMSETYKAQLESGVLERFHFAPIQKESVILKAVPYFLAGLLLLMIWAVLSSRANQANNMLNFGRARTLQGPGKQKITFQDVAGVEEEKAELQEIVEFMQDPKRFRDMGAKIPKGVLLVGPPGTGKTLLARAVAGESGVPFLSISGSDFLEMYVGVGASRVRDLFSQAKKVSPAIIFIDEIDAIGRQRGTGMGGGHDEREQTLNQMLVEMDGFEKNEGVIVMAATNRKDILDPALLRPGRFDRQIYVGTPDARGREEILKLYTKEKRLSSDVSLSKVAAATGGFTGADLENLMNEAAILAVRAKHPAITSGDLDEAMLKILAGPQKRSRVQLGKDRRITAVHEAGHAVVAFTLPEHDPVHQITIVPRGGALGLTLYLPEQENVHLTRNQMYGNIVSSLGGRVAEELFCQDISTGASEDLRRATDIARQMVARYGMSDAIGPIAYDDYHEIFVGRDYERTRSYSEQVAGDLDAAVKTIIEQAHAQCSKTLKEHGQKLLTIAEYLLQHETMTGAQFKACMEGKDIPKDDTGHLFDPV